MRSRSLAVAMLLLAGSLLVAGAGHVQGLKRRSDASWLLTRAEAQVSAYPETFDGKHVDAALVTFGERRTKMNVAWRYDLLRALGFMGFGVAAIWLYALFLLSRFQPLTGQSEEKERVAVALHAPIPALR